MGQWAAIACLALFAGCVRDIGKEYGKRTGLEATSVNGTTVLGEMFERAGHQVLSWRMLSPKLEQRADCIVWFPDDFQPPSEPVRMWLENWLADRPGRTLIYVGRDFDAAAKYWETVLPGAPADQQAEIATRKNKARTAFLSARQAMANAPKTPWFTLQPQHQPRPARALQGSPAWLEGVDAAKTDIELFGRLLPAEDAQTLLASGNDPLVSRLSVDDSQILIVANGSFLLNLPLVNHEHRKLAGHLIDEIGPPRKTVVFLSSGYGGPPIRDKDPQVHLPSGLEPFGQWPTSCILFHFLLAGILFCFWRFPIFGRPHEAEGESPSDFGKHIQALAELLERSQDARYATGRVEHYQQVSKER